MSLGALRGSLMVYDSFEDLTSIASHWGKTPSDLPQG